MPIYFVMSDEKDKSTPGADTKPLESDAPKQPKKAGRPSGMGERRLALLRAQRVATDALLPINPELLARIKQRAKDGKYGTPNEFLNDIKNDPGLFSYCLKQAYEEARKIDPSARAWDYLEAATVERLTKLLPSSASRASPHTLETASELQAKQMQQALIAVTTLSELGKSSEIDPLLLFSSACLRQLGLGLIAWNFPRAYEAAMETPAKNDIEVEHHIANILGYSPSSLGLAIVKQWGLHNEINHLLSSRDGSNTESTTDTKFAQLRQLCETSEALACAFDPDHYPTAIDKLPEIEMSINAVLGPEGMKNLQGQIDEVWGDFVSAAPDKLRTSLSTKKRVKRELPAFAKKLLQDNATIKRCNPQLQEGLHLVYQEMLENQVSVASLSILLGEVVPNAGIQRGAIYVRDMSTTDTLKLQTVFGDVPREAFRPAYQIATEAIIDPLQAAIRSGRSMRGQAMRDGTEILYFAGVINSSSISRGVLYLESDRESYLKDREDSLAVFRTLNSALTDALQLGAQVGKSLLKK